MESTPADGGRKPLIFSVDDDVRIRKIVELHLTKGGYDVAFAANGAEALDKLKTLKPDLILLDVMMPGMDGYAVCRKIQESKEILSVPVVFATALGEERDKARAFAAGAVGYLVKPIQKDALLDAVREHLATASRWKGLAAQDGAPGEPGAGGVTVGDERVLSQDFRSFREHLLRQLRLDQASAGKAPALSPDDLYSKCADLGVKPRAMAQHIADYLSVPYVPHVNPKDIVLGALPTAFCRKNSVLTVAGAAASVGVVVSNPFDMTLRETLGRFAEKGKVIRIMVTEPENIAWIFRYNDASADEKARLERTLMVEAKESDDDAGYAAGNAQDLVNSAGEAPVIQLANSLLARAIHGGASDIHIEPRERSLGVRYRIDGVLKEQDALPKNLQPALVSRLKIMADLDIAEHRAPQDGSARVCYQGRSVDLRFSTLPSRHGEKVVVRILDKSAISLDFDALGFEDKVLESFREAVAKPFGIILITGPTGSGKTTTLYTALQALNDPDVNIVTVEDPVEYELHRVTQVQVNTDAGLTFPAALRSILRQDPDVIMVGEIRDAETLDIAVKAALTGHLVLSTLHTNDAPGTVIRLRDMAEPYLVGAALQMVAAQRLVRRLCPNCKKPETVPAGTLERHGFKPAAGAQFFHPAGCDACHGTGYKGRIVIAEVMPVDDALRQMIARSAGLEDIRGHAMEACGMVPMRGDALKKAAAGLTSIEEALQATV